MRSATEMPDQSSSGGVSPARNTLLAMTRRPPVSDDIVPVYHNGRDSATARSGASAQRGKGGAAAANGGWLSNRSASAAGSNGPSSSSHTAPASYVGTAEFTCSNGNNGNDGAAKGAAFRGACPSPRDCVVCRDLLSMCCVPPERILDIPTSGLHVRIALGCLPND